MLERERPEGWRFEVERLCDQWAEGEGLPKQPQPTSRAELHDEHPALAVQPDPDLGISCPYCHRPYDVPDETPAGIPAVDLEHLAIAFERGQEQGRAEGQREILKRLFAGATTSQQIVERAATMAFADVWPDGCPLTPTDLAAITGISRATAKRRRAQANLSHSFADE